MRYFIKHEDHEWIASPDAASTAATAFEIQAADDVDTRRHEVTLLSDSALLVDEHVVRVTAREQIRPGVFRLELELQGHSRSLIVETERARALAFEAGSAEFAAHEVKSPMPGRVLKLLVNEGDALERGAPLLVVEAMKMENQINAERSGTVERLAVKVGDTVEAGQLLMTWK